MNLSRPDRRRLFTTPSRVELATERCDLSCDWCDFCRGRDVPAQEIERVWSSTLRPGTPSLRIRGGDPFRYGDLSTWVRWARQEPSTAVIVEGPAAALAGDDRGDVVQRIIAAAPDAVSILLPTVDIKRTTALTGARWDPHAAIASLAQLIAVEMPVEIVFPVHPATVRELPSVVLRVAEELGDAVEITLRRCPPAAHRHETAAADWTELDDLSDAIAALPETLPRRARLQLDPVAAYAPCLLGREARRSDLFAAGERRITGRPLGAICDDCAWSRLCTFRTDHGVPPNSRVRPLTASEAQAIGPERRTAMGAEPHRFHTDRASLGLPNLLCLAPWTTLTATDPRRNSVPCALSWVDSDMSPEEITAEIGTSVDDERERETIARAERQMDDASWYVVDNERLSLMELWNSPLLRLMRREMTGGEKSSRCRAMCRVVMGVEERGVSYFQRSESELTPQIVANRRLLLEEVCAGKDVLTAKPVDLVIGVSSHCNISCGFCDGPLGSYGDLSDRRRDEIIGLLPSLMSFGVCGPGEPLMNKNFLALLRHISDTDYRALVVSLTTNGTLMTPQLLARTANVPWGSVRFSVNAGSAETYERMTGKAYFDRIMTNLDALCELRERSQPRFSITLSLVLGSVQMGDLAKFAKIVHDHRTGIVVEPMYDNMRNLSPWIQPDRLSLLAAELGGVADAYVDKNEDIARAFRAVERFARSRLASVDFAVLQGH